MSEDPSSSINEACLKAHVSGFMPSLDLSLDDAAWQQALPHAKTLSHEVVREVFMDQKYHLADEMELSIILSNDHAVQQLNRDYRGKDKPTNVLSFNAFEWQRPLILESGQWFDGQPLILGDIVLALETVQLEAKRDGKSFEHHYMHLLVHGVLHLLGFDHIDNDEAEQMEQLEATILRRLGVSNPYDMMGAKMDMAIGTK